MDKYIGVISAIGGVLFGALGGYLTYLISRHSAKKGPDSMPSVMASNMARFAVDLAFLLAAYFASKVFELPMLAVMLGVALGLTVCGMLLLLKLSKEIMREDNANENGGE